MSERRRIWGFVLAVVVPAFLTAVLLPLRDTVNLTSTALLFLAATIAVALIGGRLPAIVAALVGSLLLNFFFTAPRHRLSVADENDALALFVFLAVAISVASVVDLAAHRRRRLDDAAAQAAALAETDRLRTALLQAVSHDLRTPLAGAKASVSAVLSAPLADADRESLLRGADASLDQLTALIADLLDMSRLQAGALPLTLRPTDLAEVLGRVLVVGDDDRRVRTDVAADASLVLADPGLLERILANLLGNALGHTNGCVEVDAARYGDTVRLRVIDHGPGVPLADRARLFVPFQHAGDTTPAGGLGLGLALAHGLATAMSGRLEAETTPDGGLTMALTLPVAP